MGVSVALIGRYIVHYFIFDIRYNLLALYHCNKHARHFVQPLKNENGYDLLSRRDNR